MTSYGIWLVDHLYDLSKLQLVNIQYWISKPTSWHSYIIFSSILLQLLLVLSTMWMVSFLWACLPSVNNHRCGFLFCLCARLSTYLSPCREVSPLDRCPQHRCCSTLNSELHSFLLPVDSDGVIHCVLEALVPYVWVKHPSILTGPVTRVLFLGFRWIQESRCAWR